MSLALSLLLLTTQADGPPPGDGPRGTSGEATRYDQVGEAGRAEGPGTGVVGSALPVGSIVEVTALDTGKTVLLPVTGGAVGGKALVGLTPAAAAALGISERAPVRVRSIHVGAAEEAAIRAGRPGVRLDAPPALLAGLRQKLAGAAVAAAPRAEPVTALAAVAHPATVTKPDPASTAKPVAKPDKVATPKPTAAPRPTQLAAPSGHGIFVQVAALADRPRAEALARAVHGFVAPAGKAYRVRIGPFADAAAARQASARLATTGHPGAQLVHEQ